MYKQMLDLLGCWWYPIVRLVVFHEQSCNNRSGSLLRFRLRLLYQTVYLDLLEDPRPVPVPVVDLHSDCKARRGFRLKWLYHNGCNKPYSRRLMRMYDGLMTTECTVIGYLSRFLSDNRKSLRRVLGYLTLPLTDQLVPYLDMQK